MDRLRDYVGFAVGYVGLGYLVMWPLSASGSGGALFGAPLLCHGSATTLLATLCRAPHPLTLSPSLHWMGLLSAVFVTLRLSCRVLGRALHVCMARARRIRAVRPVSVPDHLMPAPATRPPPPALPRVKPRSQFGLRGGTR